MPELIERLLKELLAKHDNVFEASPEAAPTGSRVICSPPVLSTDEDWLVYVPESLQAYALEWLENEGATCSATQKHYPDGVCYHFGDLNPILIWDWSTYYRWVAATWAAQKFNIEDKAERTRFFAALVDAAIPIVQLKLQPCNPLLRVGLKD